MTRARALYFGRTPTGRLRLEISLSGSAFAVVCICRRLMMTIATMMKKSMNTSIGKYQLAPYRGQELWLAATGLCGMLIRVSVVTTAGHCHLHQSAIINHHHSTQLHSQGGNSARAISGNGSLDCNHDRLVNHSSSSSTTQQRLELVFACQQQ
jgi:hypothetical protein